MDAGRQGSHRTELLLSAPKRRLRCRLCSTKRREIERNHGAQERDCGRAGPSPAVGPLAGAPGSISALSLSAELCWGTKASGRAVHAARPRLGSAALPQGACCLPAPADLLFVQPGGAWGTGIPSFSWGTSKRALLAVGLAGSLSSCLQPPGALSLGLLQSPALFSLQGLPWTCRDRPAALQDSAGCFGSCVLQPPRTPLCRYRSRNRHCCFSCLFEGVGQVLGHLPSGQWRCPRPRHRGGARHLRSPTGLGSLENSSCPQKGAALS